jgi:TPR repeat protein
MKTTPILINPERFPWLLKARFDVQRYLLALEISYSSLFWDRVTRIDVLGWMMAARWGLAEGQLLLAECYNYGIIVKSNQDKRFRWLLAAVHQGYAPAQERLGWHYACEGSLKWDERDWHKVVLWLTEASDQNYPKAHVTLGSCCWRGEGIREDRPEALRLFKKAAAQQCYGAFHFLGGYYSKGKYVDRDLVKGNWYYKRAKRREAFVRTCLKKSLDLDVQELLIFQSP